MRKIVLGLFTICLCLHVLPGKAQGYHKFLNNSSWYESENDGFGQPINYYYYNQSTDTTINNMTYAKILVTSGTPFFAREDTLAKKVYVRDYNGVADALLYDFSLNVGDTFRGQQGYAANYTLTVKSIDTVTTQQGSRRRFNLIDASGMNGFSTIESIGCILDPFLNVFPGGDPVMQLVCSYQNQNQVYDCACGYVCYLYGTQPIPCSASFSYTNESNGQVTFLNIDAYGYSYNWLFNTSPLLDTTVYSPSISYTFPCNGTFEIECSVLTSAGTYSNTCQATQYITVTNAGNLTAGYTYTIGSNNLVNFTNTSTGDNAASYSWNVHALSTNDLVGSSSTVSPTFMLSPDSAYVINLLMYSNFSECVSSYSDTIYMPKSFAEIQQLSNNNEQVLIYPNPASTGLQVAVSTGQIAGVKMYDVLGNAISAGHVELAETSAQLDVSGLTNGVYFIEVRTVEGIYTKKIVVQH